MRNFRHLLVLIALAALATGCRLDLTLQVDLDNDGGGTLALELEVDQDLVDRAVAAGVDPLAALSDRVAALDGPWEVTQPAPDPADGQDGRRILVRTGFGDPAEFAARYEELRVGLDAPEARLLGPLTLTLDEEAEVIRLTGDLPLELTEVAAADQGTDLPTLVASLDGVVHHELVVRTPVPVLEASQQGVEPEDGGEVITLAVPLGQRATVDVAFQPAGLDLARIGLYGGGGLLAVLLVVAGVMAERRRT